MVTVLNLFDLRPVRSLGKTFALRRLTLFFQIIETTLPESTNVTRTSTAPYAGVSFY